MHYDPIKELLGKVFNRHPLIRRLFYSLLNVLLLRSWHVRKALKKAARNISPSASVLDAGMGFGQYTWWMAGKFPGWSITASDIKQEQVSDCNSFFDRTGISERVKATDEDLVTMQAAGIYDLIVCVDVMEHIEQDRMVFSNFCRALKGGGMVVISTPSDKGGSDVHDEGDESFIGEHVRDGYSVEDITLKLSEAGFKNICASYTYGTAGSIAWRLSMKYPVLMLSASKLFFILLPFYYILVMPFCLVLNFIDLYKHNNEGTGKGSI